MSDDAVRSVALPTLLAAFGESRDGFRGLTAKARQRFAARDWLGMQADTVARLEVHAGAVAAAAARLRDVLGEAAEQRPFWMRGKQAWGAAIPGRAARVVARRGVAPALDFPPYDFAGAWSEPAGDVVRTYGGPAVTPRLVDRLLRD